MHMPLETPMPFREVDILVCQSAMNEVKIYSHDDFFVAYSPSSK